MLADLADFEHDYRSVNLQCLSAGYAASTFCDTMQRLIAAWSGLEQRVLDKAINKWHGWLCASVETDGQHFKHLLWAANFSFWTDFTV